jgi:hypothetical protein
MTDTTALLCAIAALIDQKQTRCRSVVLGDSVAVFQNRPQLYKELLSIYIEDGCFYLRKAESLRNDPYANGHTRISAPDSIDILLNAVLGLIAYRFPLRD